MNQPSLLSNFIEFQTECVVSKMFNIYVLADKWSRSIFNVASDYSLISKEEREEHDSKHLSKRRRISVDSDHTRSFGAALQAGKK